MRNLSFLLCLLALLCWSHSTRASESQSSCTGSVAQVPMVISTPGTWCLRADFNLASTSAKAITIASDNVTLDCNDFALTGTGATGTTAIGVYTQNHLNITIRHCNIRGFRSGVWLQATTGGGGNVVEYNNVNQNVFTGIRVDGSGSVVRHNQVYASGGTAKSPNAYGIYSVGSVDLIDNTVSNVGVAPGSNGSAYGIYTSGNTGGTIEGNRVRGLISDNLGKTYGIFNATSGHITLRDNDLFGNGSSGSIGLGCANSTGRALGNVINGFEINLNKCGDAGNNGVH